MTWTAAIMPDDALPDDSLVGRMLKPEPEFTAEEVEMHAAPWAYLEPPEPLPLWRVMLAAGWKGEAAECWAAEIEALRDWLLPEEPAVISDSAPDDPIWARFNERQRLRDRLTEQARIARGEP
jgi:hypothetical protein